MVVEINDDISLVELLKMESDTQEKVQERNILLSLPILKFIDENEIDGLTVENENNLRTSQPRKALYHCQHCAAKVIRRHFHSQSIYQNVQLLLVKHYQKVKV